MSIFGTIGEEELTEMFSPTKKELRELNILSVVDIKKIKRGDAQLAILSKNDKFKAKATELVKSLFPEDECKSVTTGNTKTYIAAFKDGLWKSSITPFSKLEIIHL